MTRLQRKVMNTRKQLARWSDAQLQHAWDNPQRRKDGVVSIKGALFCDAILAEQIARRRAQ